MSERKLTIQVIVNQDAKDWHWVLGALGSDNAVNGLDVCSVSNEWTSEETAEALMYVHNRKVSDQEEFDL